MPQMAPLNWLPLLLAFSAILIIISIINYFITNQHPKNLLFNKISLSKPWKW
uniref:ATP synthase complex subunit 8 n=1 Tax=Dorcus hopei TaxID=618762 RepID=A0A344AUX9_9SCAR|nr:ATP synthase F0 subunit 8 [Dorcus hopei]AWX65976.1 ATP synthase F0 subunit 8 [Dorcus hopei]WMW30081.1 ATP synthase F0 subunit 8 [Dorcus hopei]